jgi:TusE/DsrC/DsvC family sulfur relay protein
MNDVPVPNKKPGNIRQRLCAIAGREIALDDEGFLWHTEDWTEEIAQALASECGIDKLNDTQWLVVEFLRNYFSYHGRAPLNRDLKAGVGISLMELEALFPEGIRRCARRVAGLPNPKSCA